jgi:hypothetical protein
MRLFVITVVCSTSHFWLKMVIDAPETVFSTAAFWLLGPPLNIGYLGFK